MMNVRNLPGWFTPLSALALTLAWAGCGTPQGPSSKFKLADGRTVSIGESSPAPQGGTNYHHPHLKQCWVAQGFDFNGYDTLYIVPTFSTATYQPDEEMPHALAKENLVIELARKLGTKNMFGTIVTNAADIKPDAKVLKVENTIVEYAKGGGAARYFAGLYGGGQPRLRVEGKMTDADKPVFTYEASRSGVSAGARMTGAFMKDMDIQLEDIRSMVLDLTDFMAIIARKEPLRE